VTERVERRFRQVMNGSRDAYIEADGRGRITEWSAAAESLLGWRHDDVVGLPVSTVLSSDDAVSVARSIGMLQSTTLPRRQAVPDVFTVHVPLIARSGSTVTAVARIFAVGKRSRFRVCAFLRPLATDSVLLAEPVPFGAVFDHRTRLASRHVFDRRLDSAVHGIDRSSSVAVVALDLDRFGLINDALGAEVGDLLLNEVAERLRAAASRSRGRPLLARRGGAQFLALFRRSDGRAGEEAERFAERFLQSLEAPVMVGDREIFVSASAGVCATRCPDVDASDMVANASSAAYESTRAGGGQVRKFDAAMRQGLVDRLATESALHHALERQELTVHYQPVVDMASQAAVGVEALLRWQHPDLGLLGPQRFIPVAEESGLILPIGAWVLEEASRQMTRWRAQGSWFGSVAVNLSARQFDDPELLDLVRGALGRGRLPASSLVCEITESTLMRDAESSLAVLRALKALGVVLAIDDFGTGFSSLSYLRHFPVDMLKIDKCFVQSIEEPESAKIVAAIANLARELGMVVVAEGVESAVQAHLLGRLGCDLAQGMWYGPPLAAVEVVRTERARLEA
jgi:diguanylate cyclase (GGDEF)-like protein/PAS domain S-box-containing protein